MSKIGDLTKVEEALPEILVLTHGYFGKELIKSAEMIMGTIEGINFIPLTTDFSVEEYRDMVGNAINGMKEGSVILLDLLGGTPCNTVAIFSRTRQVDAIVGVNLCILMETALLRGKYKGKELCEQVLESTQCSIQKLKL